MFAALVLSSLFAVDLPLSSEVVFGQMRAASVEIKSLSFDFRCSEAFTARIGEKGPPKTTERNFIGKAWFGIPNRLRVEFSDGDSLEFDARTHRTATTAVSEGGISRLLAVDRNSGFTSGTVTEGATTFIAVPGLVCFCLRSVFDEHSKYLQFDKIEVSKYKSFLRLAGRGIRDIDRIEWDVDPSRGFSLVSQKRDVNHPWGHSRSEVSYELQEAKAGIWIPQYVITKGYLNGEITQHIVAEAISGTVKINERLPDGVFELPFPPGTNVTNSNQKTSYIEGGGGSRSRESIVKLAKEAKQYDSEHPTTVPQLVLPITGALTADLPARSKLLWIGVPSLLVVIGGVFGWNRWRSRQ